MKISIRRIREADLPRIQEIVTANYGKLYGRKAREEYAQCFSSCPIRPKGLALTVDGVIVTIAAVIGSFDYHVEAITWVNTHPDFQGRGYGKKLISHILEKAPKETHYHLLTTTLAVDFYKKLGFEILTEIKPPSNTPKTKPRSILMGKTR